MQMLPGISNPDGRASSLHIRGGTPDQNLILWDNIPIYYGGHFFGMVSPFNPYLVQDMKVYRSGFDAKYEGRVSGTINITSINEIPDSINGGIGVNLTHADAYLSIPFKKINTALILGARKSYFNQWKSPYFNSISNLVFQDTKVGYSSNDTNVIVHQFNTDYHDYKAKLIVDVSNKDKAFISFFTAKNKMTYSFTDTLNNIYSIDDFELVNQGASASWERKWNTRLKTNLDLTYSDYKYSSYDTLTVSDADTTIIWLNNDNSNNMTDIQLRFSNAIQLAPGHRLEVGGQFNTRELLNKYLENYAFEPSFYGSISNYATTTSFFGDYTYSLKNRLLLRPGFRYTYHKELNKHYYEPRIYGQYKAFSNVAIKASAGIYHQDISQLVDVGFNQLGVGNELWVLADGKEIESIDSKQVMVGANFNKNGWWLDAEGYYKTIAGITTFSKSLSNIANRPFEYGDATVIGLDLFVKKRWNNYRAWVSYTLSKTDYLFESVSTESFPAPHDQTHSMRLGQLYKWKQIEVSLAWQFSSGRPYHITDSVGAEYFADIQDSGYFLVWQPNNIGRLPAFHQLDLSVLYNFPNKRRKRWNAKIGFSLKNIYNRRNTLSRRYLLYYDANDLGPSEYYGFQIYSYDLFHQGILPNLLLRFEW